MFQIYINAHIECQIRLHKCMTYLSYFGRNVVIPNLVFLTNVYLVDQPQLSCVLCVLLIILLMLYIFLIGK